MKLGLTGNFNVDSIFNYKEKLYKSTVLAKLIYWGYLWTVQLQTSCLLNYLLYPPQITQLRINLSGKNKENSTPHFKLI